MSYYGYLYNYRWHRTATAQGASGDVVAETEAVEGPSVVTVDVALGVLNQGTAQQLNLYVLSRDVKFYVARDFTPSTSKPLGGPVHVRLYPGDIVGLEAIGATNAKVTLKVLGVIYCNFPR